MLPSTSGSEILAVLSEGCMTGQYQDVENCSDRRGLVYQSNVSSSFRRIGGEDDYFSLPVAEPESGLGRFEGSAQAGYDNVTFGWQNEGGPSIRNHTVFSYAVKSPFIGQLGLSHWPTNLASFNSQYQSVLDAFRTAGSIVSWSWSYTAGAHYRTNNAFASLTLGGKDTSKFDTSHIAEFQLGSDNARDLLVTLSTIQISDNKSSAPALPITVWIDSTVSSIYLPGSICAYFETAFDLTWNASTNLYTLNSTHRDSLLARNASVTFSLESTTTSVDITLPYAAFDLEASYPLLGTQVNGSLTSYYFPLQRTQKEDEYALGRVFLQEAYLIVDYDRRKFSVAPTIFRSTVLGPSDDNPLEVIYPPDYGANGTSNSGNRSGLSSASIGGIVIGAIVGILAILAFSLYTLKRRRQTRRAARMREEHDYDVANRKPELDSRPSKPGLLVADSAATELDSKQQTIVEMGGEEKKIAEAMGHELGELPSKESTVEMAGRQRFELGGDQAPVELAADESGSFQEDG